MGIEEESGGSRNKRHKPVDLNWEQLLPSSSGDEDRTSELVVISKKKSKGGGSGGDTLEIQKEDLELQTRPYNEIIESIARFKKNLQKLSHKLPDKGEKFRANLQRHEDELERRNKLQSEKGDSGCDETIQLSDHSDEGDSSGKKKSNEKSSSSSSSSSKFAKLFKKKLDEESRTVNAFEPDFSFMNHCQGRKGKPNSQLLGKGKSKKGLSSTKTPVVDNEKQIISNDDKKNSDFNSSPDRLPPLRNLRPRHKRTYHLVDEEPQFHSKIPYAELDICYTDVKVYYPSRDDPGSVEVNYADMACLAPEACLSSTIMNFYIRYLQQPTSSTSHYHFFNTYFYNKLEKLSYEEDSFLKFRKWWKGVNLFEKAYILLPIHESAHWSLVIICFPTNEDELGPILLHLDSLGLHNSKSLFENLKRFLKEEWGYIRKSEPTTDVPIPDEIWENLDCKMDHRRVTVPQQMNDYDCGLFVLLYMERFIKEAPTRLKKKHLSMFGKQWFQPEEASDLRVRVHNLLVEEFKNVKENESRI